MTVYGSKNCKDSISILSKYTLNTIDEKYTSSILRKKCSNMSLTYIFAQKIIFSSIKNRFNSNFINLFYSSTPY